MLNIIQVACCAVTCAPPHDVVARSLQVAPLTVQAVSAARHSIQHLVAMQVVLAPHDKVHQQACWPEPACTVCHMQHDPGPRQCAAMSLTQSRGTFQRHWSGGCPRAGLAGGWPPKQHQRRCSLRAKSQHQPVNIIQQQPQGLQQLSACAFDSAQCCKLLQC